MRGEKTKLYRYNTHYANARDEMHAVSVGGEKNAKQLDFCYGIDCGYCLVKRAAGEAWNQPDKTESNHQILHLKSCEFHHYFRYFDFQFRRKCRYMLFWHQLFCTASSRRLQKSKKKNPEKFDREREREWKIL